MFADKDILKIKRVKKNLTKQRLGEISGISRQQISIYEDDANKCPLGRFIKLAEILEFDPKEIFLSWESQIENKRND